MQNTPVNGYRHFIRCLLAGAVLAPLLLTAGCATTQLDRSQYVRDGVQYGVTEGRFRGRWWNYYERGRSFLEGGYYEEALLDFRAALAGRSRDQLWPRTYGLHFTPEYFPNREMGVALYYQGKLGEGLERLEASNQQRYSARGAYFLGEARRMWLASEGGDSASPTLEILAPSGDMPVGATEVEIIGVARDDTYISEITVNGEALDVKVSAPEVRFTHRVRLLPGQNEVALQAVDLLGKSTTLRVSIESDVDGPAVSFDTPVVFPGVIRGVAYDPTGIAAMSIAGRPATFTDEGFGLIAFSVDLSSAPLDAPPQFVCEDVLGNVTSGRLPISTLVRSTKLSGAVFAHDAVRVARLPGGMQALMLGGEVIAVTAASEDETGVRVTITNVEDGDRYFQDEIVVALAVKSNEPIGTITLNGRPIPAVPGRTETSVTRRLRLEKGANEMLARADDVLGRFGEDRKSITRAETEIEMAKNRLSVAFLSQVSKVRGPGLEQDIETILDSLQNSEKVDERFRIVDRALLPEVLAEQELSAYLSSAENRLALKQLRPAEVLFAATVRKDEQSIEIVLNGTSAETSERIVSYVSVAGRYEELERLIDDLGVRLVQEFPRVNGLVWDWTAPEITFDINRSHGIHESMKCVVFRLEKLRHPVTGEETGKTIPRVIGEGLINSVGKELSSAEVFSLEEGQDAAALPIELGHRVVIK